ncbi:MULTISPECIES: SCO family protein [unclassified Sphingomonas]|uniref:SCO family protein n=1 Tax=unclassified Sphingomonas TaxID=196159 RepID=UPI0006FD57F0|nr:MULTISPECIES: SCO family protein [unclassified Sphingomonas]KQN21601.1 electron transporter [Sphingomonas sp. Leaf30]MBD8551352.1 SCO family protein [Sphingomonas sp. CFBP 8764]
MTNRRPALLAALALAACSPSAPDTSAAPATPPLAGARIGGPFTLVDQDGQQVSDRLFAGQYRIMYFGYTFCPDVCPTDMQTIGGAMKLLEASDPALAARIVPIFVTVDPTRDTPAVVKQFVTAFHPRIVGLTGSPASIETVKKEFAIFSAKGDAAPGGGYLVNHSRQAYLMDPDGKPLALLPQDKGPQALADDIKRWAR